jgi:hypothetical protein
MRRNYWVVVASAVVIGVLTGCSDTLVAPSAAPSAAPASTMLAPTGRPSLSLSGRNSQNGVSTFTISPAGGVYLVGNHAVVFPARSVCDPATSSYGEGTWDESCTPLKRALKVTAQVVTTNGAQAIDFTPSIRFVPSADPSRWVWLYMYTPGARGASDLSQFNILFAPSLGATPVNDALTDPTMRTYVDSRTGISFRRIKHFTGYIAPAGFTCDANSEGGCGSNQLDHP